MHVEPGNHADYQKMESIWKKIHESRMKSGELSNWNLYRVVSPYGSASDYNYIAMNTYIGTKQLAGHYENEMMGEHLKILSEEEMKWVNKTSDFRTLVKEEIFQMRNHTRVDGDRAKFIRVNYMKFNEGFRGSDMGAVEEKYWKPVHMKGIEEGLMLNWGLYSLEYPYGANTEYSATTVDFFANMEQMLNQDYSEIFSSIHKDKTMDEIMIETRKPAKLVKAEIWELIDFTTNE
jgi:hypothetical protein